MRPAGWLSIPHRASMNTLRGFNPGRATQTCQTTLNAMASQHLAIDLAYLSNAAYMLRGCAPETSAHLMRQRADLLHHSGLSPNEAQQQHVCRACGHIMILGQASSVRMQPCKTQRRRSGEKAQQGQRKSLPVTGPTKTISCGFCGSITTIGIPPPGRITHRRIGKKGTSSTAQTMGSENQAKKPTANASSKKRAKHRKGGLQALLSSQQQTSGPSLSLANFRQ